MRPLRHGRRAILALGVLAVIVASAAQAEQASDPGGAPAGGIDAGYNHTCALLPLPLPLGLMRCWGFSREGELGYANTITIGDDETPAAAGPIDFGQGRRVTAFSAGDFHTCALLDDASVRCWGFGGNGRLGYGNQENIGDDEPAGAGGPVDLGPGRSAVTIAAGGSHTCAVLDNGTVRCWGHGFYGELGHGDREDIGDNETPGSVAPVDLGGQTAKAITAGDVHTCALLDNGSVRCWGFGGNGQLGYAGIASIGDDETPGSVGPVDFGPGRTARAISAGPSASCAVLDNASVRCWGFGGDGRLGYGNGLTIGDSETPGSVAPVDLGLGRSAKAIAVGDGHTCALLDNGSVRCWGFGGDGRLGYANRNNIGDNETPGSVGPVNLGAGRSAVAIALGRRHTCARLDDASVRCWGYGGNGRLGLCSEANVGDDETPGSTGPIDLGLPGGGAAGCPAPRGVPTPKPPTTPAQTPGAYPLGSDKARLQRLRACLSRAARHTRREIRRARRLSGGRRAQAKRHLKHERRRLRRACLKRHGRTPGRITALVAHAISRTKIALTWRAPGTDGSRPPAARGYRVKQSTRPIRGKHGFERAQTLCKGSCRFPGVRVVGARVSLTITGLRPHTTYYYAVAARDNVSHRVGRSSAAATARTN